MDVHAFLAASLKDQLCRQADPASWQTCAHLNVGSLAFEGVEASLTNVCGPRSIWQCALCWLQAASLLHWHAKTPMGGTRQLDSTRVSGSLTSQRCSDILSTCHLQQGYVCDESKLPGSSCRIVRSFWTIPRLAGWVLGVNGIQQWPWLDWGCVCSILVGWVYWRNRGGTACDHLHVAPFVLWRGKTVR